MPKSVCVGVILEAGMSFSAVVVNQFAVKGGRYYPTVDVVQTTERCSDGANRIEFISE
jgi:hypothetical protein